MTLGRDSLLIPSQHNHHQFIHTQRRRVIAKEGNDYGNDHFRDQTVPEECWTRTHHHANILEPLLVPQRSCIWSDCTNFDSGKTLPPIDKSREALAPGFQAERSASSAQRQASQSLRNKIPDLKLRWNAVTGTPRNIYSTTRLLTQPTNQEARIVVRKFLKDNTALFQLTSADLNTLVRVRESKAPGTPAITGRVQSMTHIALEQRWQGRQVYPANLAGSVTGQGQLVSLAGEVVPNIGAAINTVDPELKPLDAIKHAAKSIDASFDSTQHTRIKGPEGAELRQTFTAGSDFASDVQVRLIYYIVARDDVRLVWEVTTGKAGNPFAYQVLVDALSGDILFRETITDQDVPQWRVYAETFNSPTTHPKDDYQPRDNPRPLSPGPAAPDGSQGSELPPVNVQTNGDPGASPQGWLREGVMTTTGNNVIAFVDRNDNHNADPDEQPTATLENVNGVQTRTFNFPPDLANAPETEANEHAATTNTFLMANWYHDRLMLLGFDEAAGNFQDNNFSGSGVGGDPILARLHVGTNNSTFGTPAADGTCCPTLNAYTWTGPNPDRDAGFDQEVLIHEFTHGLTNRIIGGPNVRGLGAPGQPGGLGEGYSDAYSFLLLSRPDDDIHGNYTMGGYSLFHWVANPANWEENYYFGIRHFPYTTDLCKNPFTLIDMQPATYDLTPIPEAECTDTPPVSPWMENRSGGVHDMGEIWAVSLWEVRTNLVTKHDWEIGHELMVQLVTDSLFLLERNPTFIEARDAVLRADVARTGGENSCEIWRGFAKRGFGVDAQTPTQGAFTESFKFPESCDKPIPPTTSRPKFSYSAKIVCGLQKDPDDLRLVPGLYATTVNIHNPSSSKATFTKTLALTLPPKEQKPGEVHRIAEDTLEPNQALATDCMDIQRRVFNGAFPESYIEGFVLIKSNQSLDVTAVYSTASFDREGNFVEQRSIDIEQIKERATKALRGDQPDLVPVPNENGSFCKIRNGKLVVTVKNQGAGAAVASRTGVDFGSHGQASLNTPALATGASTELVVDIPSGCHDPDCEFTIKVDSDSAVNESQESNNDGSGTCIG